MNVYVHELAQTMARRGVAVDVFTRRAGAGVPPVVQVSPRYRVVHVDAGAADYRPAAALAPLVGEFAGRVVAWATANGASYDLLHSHYWLSGWAGLLLKDAMDLPLVNSFHTLGRVKDSTRRSDEAPTALLRLATEQDVVTRSDCLIASTPAEADDLVDHYQAATEGVYVSPPGVDHAVFTPGDMAAARRNLGLADGPLALFVGRIQPLKGLDVAVRAIARTSAAIPQIRFLSIGGPSGPSGAAEIERVRRLADELGCSERVELLPIQPHDRIADFYRAADVLLAPSRSETFGLVAVEAQACGLPVVATRVGGFAYTVVNGESGALVDRDDPGAVAHAIERIVGDPVLAARLRAGAIRSAQRFSWPATADRFLEVYEGLLDRQAA